MVRTELEIISARLLVAMWISNGDVDPRRRETPRDTARYAKLDNGIFVWRVQYGGTRSLLGDEVCSTNGIEGIQNSDCVLELLIKQNVSRKAAKKKTSFKLLANISPTISDATGSMHACAGVHGKCSRYTT